MSSETAAAWTGRPAVHPEALDLTTTVGVLVALQEAVVCLWVLSDESLWLHIHGRGSSGETRRLHEDTVARRAAEVHSALDSPVVLPYGTVKQNIYCQKVL